MYIETSSPRSIGDVFPLTYDGSACPGVGIAEIQLYYHMYGSTVGTLRVKDSAGKILWTKSGNQGSAWTSVDIEVNGPSFKIEGVRGGSYTGDIAIDDVNVRCWQPKTYGFEAIYPATVWTTSPPTGTYAWTRRSGSTSSGSTGPSSAKSGIYYYYTEVSSPRQTGDKFELTLHSSDACGPSPIVSISFGYSMIGATIGTLNVKTASGTVVWTKSGSAGSGWQQADSVPVDSASVTFEGIRGNGYTGDIAIDEVTVVSCGWHLASPPSPAGCSATTPTGQWIQQSITGTWVPATWLGGRQWTYTGESCTATCAAHGKTCSNSDGNAAYLAAARDADCLMSVQAAALNSNPRCTQSAKYGWTNLPLVIVATWKSDGSPDVVACTQGGYKNIWQPYDCSKTYSHHQYFGERLCFCS